jgi:hypothetical protein
MRRDSIALGACLSVLWLAHFGRAEVRTLVEHNDNNHATPQFHFEKVPAEGKRWSRGRMTFSGATGTTRVEQSIYREQNPPELCNIDQASIVN